MPEYKNTRASQHQPTSTNINQHQPTSTNINNNKQYMNEISLYVMGNLDWLIEKINSENMLQKIDLQKIKDTKISVIGLGKLGAPMAAVFSNAGFNVTGLDLNQKFVDAINSSRAPVKEPDLQKFIDKAKHRLCATTSYPDAILNSDVSFVIVPTPSDENGLFSNDYILASLRSIGEELKRKSGYHLVVISATVLPGSMDKQIKEALEASSQKLVGSSELGLCYNPEFIALGNVINNMLRPDITLIGESDKFSGDLLESIHNAVCENSPAIRRMNFVNAELTKISINTYVTTKISYANMLAEICDHLPNADVDIVTNAVGSDTRIGKKYLQGAIGYGGPCFPRDNRAFSGMGKKLGVNCEIASATDAINDRQIDRLFNHVIKFSPEKSTVAILGLSYKPDTSEIEQSQAISLCKRLVEAGFKILAHDPQAIDNARKVCKGDNIFFCTQLEKDIEKAQTIVIATPWPDYADIAPRLKENAVLIDPWRICGDKINDNIVYIPMGKHN